MDQPTPTPPSVQDLRCGGRTCEPIPVALCAGPLTCRYESGELRDVRAFGVALVQRLYVGVRDQRWATIPGEVGEVDLAVEQRSFRITCTSRHRGDEMDVRLHMTWVGSEHGAISATCEAEILRDLRSNRLGFCILHPTPDCAGQAVSIIHVDGSQQHGFFPQAIASAPPFHDIRAIRQPVTPGCTAEIALSGDVFEMEDQRNYGDASFKTYSRPQALPKPFALAAGSRIRQEVTIRLLGTLPQPASEVEQVSVRIGPEAGPPLPRIGLAIPAGGLTPAHLPLIAALHPGHLRVTIDLTRTWLPPFTAACEAARMVGCPLEVALLAEQHSAPHLSALADCARRLSAPICSWLVMPAAGGVTTQPLIEEARRALTSAIPGALIGGGTMGHVLNLTGTALPPGLALVGVPIHAQVHATDTSTLFDNLPSHGEIIHDLARRCAPAQLAPGPITLAPCGDDLGDEPRQRALAAAAWTAASIASMAAAGIASGTWHETHGRLGVLMPPSAGVAGHERMVLPVYLLLADILACSSATTIRTRCSAPTTVAALALSCGTRRRVLLANLTPQTQHVRADGLDPEILVTRLDETCAWRAMQDPEAWRTHPGDGQRTRDGRLTLSLRPYAVARIDRR